MNKRIMLVAASVLLALIGTIAVYSYAHHADQRAVAGSKGRSVLVATKRVAAGTTWADAVKNHYLTAETMPADSTPDNAIETTTDATVGADAVAEADIAPGQIVLREAFGTKTAQTGVLSIPKGDIAVTVSLGADADVAGYVGAGAEVAIFVTGKVTTPSGKTTQTTAGDDFSVTRTLVGRAGVLATSQATPTAVTGTAITSSSSAGTVLVTLALSQKDAERVIEGQHLGDLYLGLLSASSSVSASDPGISNVAAELAPAPIFVK